MRIVLAASLAFGLSGCADSGFIDHPLTSLWGSDQPKQESPPQSALNTHCEKLARQRAGDAAFAGEDTDTQRAVYRHTYKDCVDWDAKHNS